MTRIPVEFWLETVRLWMQGAWFLEFGLALLLSLLVLKWPHRDGLRVWGRGLWITAMFGFVGMWIIGPVLELVRRAVGVSELGLVMALGAFSVLLAGVLSLVREWFGATGREPLRGVGVALSLLVFTLAGWWFGGVSLSENALWNFAPSVQNPDCLPSGWALSLGGATLLGLSKLVTPNRQTTQQRRVVNPRVASWWIAGLALTLWLPWRGQNPLAASAFLAGALPFACKMWRSRSDGPRFLRVNVGTRFCLMLFVVAAPLWTRGVGVGGNLDAWLTRLSPVWKTPLYDVAWAAFLVLMWALFRLRLPLRAELRDKLASPFASRLLLHATLSGTAVAALLLGPVAALFFAFWPLCGLFFDLLAPCEPNRSRYSPDRAEPQPQLEVAVANAAAT